MMGPSHRLLGGLAGAGVASLAGQSWAMVAMTSLVATATSNGPTSPDLDQHPAIERVLSRVLGPLVTHRYGLLHWWGLPLLAWLSVAQVPTEARWPAHALLLGWVSHLVGDLVFGQLAIFPWGGPRFGLGLDTDGFLESGVLEVFGRRLRVLPISPLRILLAAALAWVLWQTPTKADVRELVAAAGTWITGLLGVQV